MTIVNFDGVSYEGDMPLKEFALKMGVGNGFKVVGDAFKRNVSLETYNPIEAKDKPAQELIDLC